MASTLVFGISSALTFSIGILHVRNGSLSLGNLLLVIGYLGQLYGPLRSVSRRTNQLQSALAGAERAFAVLDEVPDVSDRPDARALDRATGAIEFRARQLRLQPPSIRSCATSRFASRQERAWGSRARRARARPRC